MKSNVLKDAKEVDIEKMITPDMAKAADMLGYGFLSQQGYDVSRCEQRDKKGSAARLRLKKQLERDGLALYQHWPTSENKIFCFFTLRKIADNAKVASSRTLEFVCPIIEVKEGSRHSE